MRRVDFVYEQRYSYLGTFQFLVDLITEANDVLPILLPVCWMGGFIIRMRKTGEADELQ